ncbi:aldehyde dehydrogenase [Streptomyces sp. NPDC026672]|uniref:aldehyde dehydrogenase n=1 Tax=unclassified Streptomyces TaxID=2593676 RepID=UPI0033D71ED7
MIEYSSLFIDGAWRPPSSTHSFKVMSATTGELIGVAPSADRTDADAAVAAARRAFDDPHGWSSWEPERRGAALRRFAEAMERRAQEIARCVSMQNGMPIAVSSIGEGSLPPMVLRYYADLAEATAVESTRPGLRSGMTTVRREPVGVVVAIAPWNAPQALSVFKYAPALAAGCTVVLKPSPETVLDANLIAVAASEAGLPPGVLSVLPADRDVSAYLVGHPGVDKVAFTGSTAAGRAIAEVCGKLLRPVTLELGGKSAAVMLDDIDLSDPALASALPAATIANSGQTCYLGTRVLVPSHRHDEIVEYLADLVGSLVIGDALDPTTQLGPLVSAQHRERVERYITVGHEEGGKVVTGGRRPAWAKAGWFLEPTIFTGLDNTSTLAREEIFGPVLTVIPYRDVDDAIRLANDSEYGLGGTVWTSDPERGMSVARRIRSGTLGVNGYRVDPGAPFGGVKASGLGRELGPQGLASYEELKSIYQPA